MMSRGTACILLAGFWVLVVGWTPCCCSEPDGRPRAGTDLYGDPLPQGAVARLGTIAFRQQDMTQNVGFLPDGKTVLTATPDAGLRCYEASTGKLLRSVSLGEHSVRDSAMTRDRTLLATVGFAFDEDKAANSYQVRVVDTTTGQVKLNVETPDRLDEKLAITPDGTTVVAVAGSGKLRFWDVASGAEILEYEVKGRIQIESMAFSPDSNTLAIGGRERLLLWDWATQGDPREVTVDETGRRRRRVLSLDFAPDGKTLAIGMDGRGGVPLADVTSGAVVAELNLDPSQWNYVRDVAFSPDGTRLAATRYRDWGGGVVIWNPIDKQHVCTLEAQYDGVTDIAFSPNGQKLAGVNRWASTVEVWDLRNDTKVLGDTPAHEAGPCCVEFLGDGQTVATASDDGTMRFWETRSGRQTMLLAHPTMKDGRPSRWIRAFAASPDGSLVASASLDDTVRLWDVATGKELYRLPGHGRLGGRRALAFSADGKRFVSWGDDMRLYVWDVATGKALQEYRVQPLGVDLPDEDKMHRGELIESFEIGTSAFSPDGTRFVLQLNKFYVFDVDSGKQLCDFQAEAGYVISVAVSRDNEYLLTSQWGRSVETRLADGRVRHSAARNHLVTLRRLSDGSVVKELVLPEGGAGPVAFSPDGKYFATATRRKNALIRLFLTSTGEELGQILGLGSYPTSLAFAPDNRLLASGMRNTTVLVWDLAGMMPGVPWSLD